MPPAPTSENGRPRSWARQTSAPFSHAACRRTRFVLVSDTHNATPHLPRGDVLIHAGDLSNQGSYFELSRTVQWLEKADFETKIVIAGNHDLTLDEEFYLSQTPMPHGQPSPNPSECLSLLTNSPSITYLCHSSARISLTSPTGPNTTFKIFGSPYSPRNASTFNAFTYAPSPSDLSSPSTLLSSDPGASIWSPIPFDTDILVTHTPPRFHLDEGADRHLRGCESLRRAMWRVRPRLAVCGHVHEGRGVERIFWDLDSTNVAFKEKGVKRWDDPGREGRKMSLVNLTIKGGDPLRNDGGVAGDYLSAGISSAQIPGNRDSGGKGKARDQQTLSAQARVDLTEGVVYSAPGADPILGTRGLGGDQASPRSDVQALRGRMGRQETCIVNCAIMAKSYPHRGGKVINKPIVVDLDLPVHEDGEGG